MMVWLQAAKRARSLPTRSSLSLLSSSLLAQTVHQIMVLSTSSWFQIVLSLVFQVIVYRDQSRYLPHQVVQDPGGLVAHGDKVDLLVREILQEVVGSFYEVAGTQFLSSQHLKAFQASAAPYLGQSIRLSPSG